MNPEDIKYYEELFDTFSTPGWKHITAKWREVRDAKDSVRGISTERDLGMVQGAVGMLDWMLDFEKSHRDAYDMMGDDDADL